MTEALIELVNRYGPLAGLFLFLLIVAVTFTWRELWPYFVRWRAERIKLARDERERLRQERIQDIAERRQEWEMHLASINQQRLDFARMMDSERTAQRKRDDAFIRAFAGIHRQIEANTKQVETMTNVLEKFGSKGECWRWMILCGWRCWRRRRR
jgi:hypothetical protein